MTSDFLDGAHNLETLTCACGQPSGHESGACWDCYRSDEVCGWCEKPRCVLAENGRCRHDPHTEYCDTCADWFAPPGDHWCDSGRAEAVRHSEMQRTIYRLTHSLRLLVQQLTRNQGYSTADEQADLRVARLLLAELGK